ncbi:MAG: acyl-CoA dehydrogenase family protein [Polyangiaceae bacterium]|nr:acyl-CoA dehydrogenase family protein [Polyangiaceae bacterium]
MATRGLDRETLDAALGSISEFAGRHLPDAKLLQLDAHDEFPEEIVRRMCGEELGIQLFFIPEAYGGMGGGSFDIYRICERMGSIDLGVATGVLATFLGSEPISVGGTPDQKALWLGKIASEGLLFAYAATEPQAGSDLAALRTVAERVEQNGVLTGYRITGNKQWISNGGVADAYCVLANAPGGPTWFVVEKGQEGLIPGKPEDKHGIRASNTAAVTFENAFVTPDRLVGEVEGQGLVQAQAVFGYTRLMVAAFGLGAGWAALDRAVEYSTTRIQAGSPLSEKQGYTHKLIVPHAARLEAARAYIEMCGTRLDSESDRLNTEGAIAKYLATEAGNAAADAAIQALGGYGYTKEYMVEKIKRDVRITTIYEGTSEIMEMTISRDRWQNHLKTRGAHYHDQAKALEQLSIQAPASGADIAALALHALAEVLERARQMRLTRHQHILFRLGELIAYAEGAATFAIKAARTYQGQADPRAPTRFDGEATCALARVFAREASRRVAFEGLAHVVSAGGAEDLAAFESKVQLGRITAAQAGGITDMDRVADALYGRTKAG